ncbi:MAG TPA: mevalonate kinase [Candidatus Altiarchaeales archaeon]|nr:mevalonate kinase [Candidatus Altiarchaeales archaeon]
MDGRVSEGVGYGKTILFGEHFVVYGKPAIASAIGSKTIAKVSDSDVFEFIDDRPETPGYKEKKSGEIQRQIEALLKHFKIDVEKRPLKIVLEGNLECNSGVGASAALAASISRALNQHLNLGMNDEGINEAAYIAEEAGSGTPSGIDNTCSVYGGFIVFQKNVSGGRNRIEKISVETPVEIVMAGSGITQETKKVVEDVRNMREREPELFERIFKDYDEIFSRAKKAVDVMDLKELGGLMNRNQTLLEEMTLSCPEIEEILEATREAGAYGAKLTGTGRGGSVIALTPGKGLQDRVSDAIEEIGYKTFKTSLGV